jgi:hypothetical protein
MQLPSKSKIRFRKRKNKPPISAIAQIKNKAVNIFFSSALYDGHNLADNILIILSIKAKVIELKFFSSNAVMYS